MCGIVGKINFKDKLNELEIKNLCDKLISRGPDEEGLFFEGNLGLGHRRLSIIDLELGSQPMFSLDENVVTIFNGEIYNFQEIRVKLEKLGCIFKTNSDTEVILNSYLYYGITETLKMLEGMFAFAISGSYCEIKGNGEVTFETYYDLIERIKNL